MLTHLVSHHASVGVFYSQGRASVVSRELCCCAYMHVCVCSVCPFVLKRWYMCRCLCVICTCVHTWSRQPGQSVTSWFFWAAVWNVKVLFWAHTTHGNNFKHCCRSSFTDFWFVGTSELFKRNQTSRSSGKIYTNLHISEFTWGYLLDLTKLEKRKIPPHMLISKEFWLVKISEVPHNANTHTHTKNIIYTKLKINLVA